MWALTLLIGSSAHLGWIYAVSATVLGAMFTFYALRLFRHARVDKANVAEAMRLFHFSITYLSALFILMAVDVLVRHR
jgi:protoheme IX farnesyltransferase